MRGAEGGSRGAPHLAGSTQPLAIARVLSINAGLPVPQPCNLRERE
jgi:hypothetical protein